MTLLVAWAVFPALLALLALGCGLLLEELTRLRLPGALVLPAGLAVLIVLGQAATAADATAELAVPLMLAAAVAGLVLSPPLRRGRIDPWIVAAAVIVFAVYGAPVVLSGQPTFAGFITLDDTATWLGITDHIMERGRSLEGLAPSTYEVMLEQYAAFGYPIGSFLPMGTGGELLSTDVAWLVQPSMAFFAVMLALALAELVRPLIPGTLARAAVVVIAAQPAILFGYVMWGGVKEVAAAAILALVAALASAATREGPVSTVLSLGVACSALLAILGPGGAVWLGPMLLATGVVTARRLGYAVVPRAVALAAVVAILSVPLLTGGAFEATTNSVLYQADELGNLFHPLSAFQAVGIWPAGDFRVSPPDRAASQILIGIALAAALGGLWLALRSRLIGLPLFSLGGLVGAAAIVAAGSPWVDSKALATVSPAVLVLAMTGAVAFGAGGRQPLGLLVAVVIGAGVIWSNAYAYRQLDLAPYEQLGELEEIGEDISGQGPTLMTTYEPYGTRHFLREADPEGVSELRRRPIPLRGGGVVKKGDPADIDELDLGGVLVYRTLVLRRGPGRSRPPFPYRLVDRKRFYDVWQRPPATPPELEHLPLGEGVQPAAEAPCDEVQQLADSVGPGGSLAFAPRRPTVVFALSRFDHPPSWSDPASEQLFPTTTGSAELLIQLPSAGHWRAWLGGVVTGKVELRIDGREVGSVQHTFNYGTYANLGEAELGPGSHLIELRYSGEDLHPGSAGDPEGMGPLVFTREEARSEVLRVPAEDAPELCGRRLDWVEAIPG